jgi:hypothetical protein
MNDPMHILSLGAGVQSSTLALMAASGELLPMPNAAIFADTQAEPQSVYRWLDWLEKQLPFPVIRVTAGSLTMSSLKIRHNKKTGVPYYSNMIPAFIRNPDGSKGIVGRHCTSNFKLVPILKKVRELGKIRRGQKEVGVIQWIGLSLDEVYRMKPSREPWNEKRYPLIEREMSRHDCLLWMRKHNYPTPPRSACIYCPFHSDHEWRKLKKNEPEEFSKACKFERELQRINAITAKGNTTGIPYLHATLRPLDSVDFTTADERTKQQTWKWAEECEGMCGL